MKEWTYWLLIDPFVVSGTCAILMLICLKAGFGGRRDDVDIHRPRSALIDESCMAILGLLLAFSFAAAYGKLDTRNTRIVEDANAIRTFYFRSQLLPDPYRGELKSLVADSVRFRLLARNPSLSLQEFQKLDAECRAAEKGMLSIITRVNEDKQASGMAPALMDACHDLVASHETRLAAGMDHVPLAVIFLLVFVASVSAYLLGRTEAESGRLRRRNVTLVLVVSAIVYITLDLEQPLRGFIQSNQEPILRLAESLNVSV